MNTVELLELTHKRISNGWTQGWFARDKNDNRLHTDDPNACKFCLSGALSDSGSSNGALKSARRLIISNLSRQYDNMIQFNDNRNTTKEDVLALIELAILEAKSYSV